MVLANRAIHHGIHWCDDEDDYLREHFATVTSLEALAADLGRSVGSVQQRAEKLCLKRPRQRPWKDEIIRLHSEGLHLAEIARRTNTPPSTVKSRLKTLGLAPNHKPEDYMKQVHQQRARARGLKDIGKLLNEMKRLKYGWQFPGCKTKAEAEICRLLCERNRLTASEIADVLNRKKTTWVYIILNRLVEDELLTRELVGRSNVYSLARRNGNCGSHHRKAVYGAA